MWSLKRRDRRALARGDHQPEGWDGVRSSTQANRPPRYPVWFTTLVDITPAIALRDRTRFGHVLETFVYGELLKHTTWADGNYQLFYYRDHDQMEVDVVVESTDGQLVGVEIKAAATVGTSDLRGLKRMASAAGDRFKLGVVLYDGTETLPLGDRLWAAPISTLWGQ